MKLLGTPFVRHPITIAPVFKKNSLRQIPATIIQKLSKIWQKRFDEHSLDRYNQCFEAYIGAS